MISYKDFDAQTTSARSNVPLMKYQPQPRQTRTAMGGERGQCWFTAVLGFESNHQHTHIIINISLIRMDILFGIIVVTILDKIIKGWQNWHFPRPL